MSKKTMSETEAAKKAKKFHETLIVDAENRIVQKFPERILHLNELLSMPEFQITANNIKCRFEIPITSKLKNNVKNREEKTPEEKTPEEKTPEEKTPEEKTPEEKTPEEQTPEEKTLEEKTPEEKTPEEKTPEEKTPEKESCLDSSSQDKFTPGQQHIPPNKNLSEIIKIFKPNINQLAEDTQALKMWVTLLIPKIEDGNNFGVSIQAETLNEIQHVESEATAYLEQVSLYYTARGRLISKVIKHPYIEDYQRAVDELDDRQYMTMSLIMHEIRNHYSTLHDIVIKNLEKIKKPRSSNTDSLY